MVWPRGFKSHNTVLTLAVAVLLINAVAILSEDRFLARSMPFRPAPMAIHWQCFATAISLFAPHIRALQPGPPEITSVLILTRYK
jgi:hypothetical protein